MEKMRNDKTDIGWSMTTVVSDARTGTGSWKGKQTDKPMFVANFYPNVWQLVVPASADVRKLQDLKGKAVALPPRGNTSLAEGWELLLKVSGMKLDDLGTKSFGSITENAEAIRNRQAVAMGWYTTVPASFMLDLGTSSKLKLIGVPDDAIEKMRQINPGFVRHVIPKATYGQYGVDEDVVTIQAPTILIVERQDARRRRVQDHQGGGGGPRGLRPRHRRHEGRDGQGHGTEPRPADAPGCREVLPRSRPREVSRPRCASSRDTAGCSSA